MTDPLMYRLIAGVLLFAAWLLLEYFPPKDTSVGVDKIKAFIQLALGYLLGMGG